MKSKVISINYSKCLIIKHISLDKGGRTEFSSDNIIRPTYVPTVIVPSINLDGDSIWEEMRLSFLNFEGSDVKLNEGYFILLIEAFSFNDFFF